MYREHRVVVVTPAGRERYMRLLFAQLLGYRPVVDEYRIWQNTAQPSDIAYFQSLAAAHPDFVTVDAPPPGVRRFDNSTIHHFFASCCDPDTIYVRFDDDVVQLDTPDAFAAFLDFRIDHPEYFLTYATILNNAVIAHILQRHGTIHADPAQLVGYACVDDVGWRDPSFAERLHRQILARPDLTAFRMPNWILHHYERVSINCISWRGAEFAAFGGEVGPDEEPWLSHTKPAQLGKPCCIFGGYAVVHYAFHPQRGLLDTTDILERYADRVLPAVDRSLKEGQQPTGLA